MRTIVLLPLSALLSVIVGCGPEGGEQAARSYRQRDLTLVTQTDEVKIASPVETQLVRIQRTARPSRRAARPAAASLASAIEPKIRLASVTAPAPVLAAPQPAAQPASTASTPANDRELLPGKTVTLIPASSGPATEPDGTDEPSATQGRTMVARGGGTCRGRGRRPGIGISGAPRPDFR
jgi:hypothetical protein